LASGTASPLGWLKCRQQIFPVEQQLHQNWGGVLLPKARCTSLLALSQITIDDNITVLVAQASGRLSGWLSNASRYPVLPDETSDVDPQSASNGLAAWPSQSHRSPKKQIITGVGAPAVIFLINSPSNPKLGAAWG